MSDKVPPFSGSMYGSPVPPFDEEIVRIVKANGRGLTRTVGRIAFTKAIQIEQGPDRIELKIAGPFGYITVRAIHSRLLESRNAIISINVDAEGRDAESAFTDLFSPTRDCMKEIQDASSWLYKTGNVRLDEVFVNPEIFYALLRASRNSRQYDWLLRDNEAAKEPETAFLRELDEIK